MTSLWPALGLAQASAWFGSRTPQRFLGISYGSSNGGQQTQLDTASLGLAVQGLTNPDVADADMDALRGQRVPSASSTMRARATAEPAGCCTDRTEPTSTTRLRHTCVNVCDRRPLCDNATTGTRLRHVLERV